MSRVLSHRARNDGATVDFFYGARRIAELRWHADPRTRHTGTSGWTLVLLHHTGEPDWDGGSTACGDERKQARLTLSTADGDAWALDAQLVRDETRDHAIARATEELRDSIAHQQEHGLEPFPELNQLT